MNIMGKEKTEPFSLYLQTLDVPEGEELETCKEIIIKLLVNSESDVDASIFSDMKKKFNFGTEEVKNLNKFHTEERKVEKTKKTPFSTIGNLIQNTIPIFTMKDTNEMYIYKNGVYKNEGSRSFLDRKIRDSCAESRQNATRNFVEEVLAYIRAYTYVDRNEVDQGHYINFKNGMFNFETGDLEEHSPNHKSIRQIPVEYDPEAKCPNIEKFLSDVVAPENIPLIYEWIGLSLIPDTRFGKALMLYGNGSNGNRLSQNSPGLYIWVINIGIFIFFKSIYHIKSILLKKINSSVSHVQKVRSKAAIFTSIESGRVCF